MQASAENVRQLFDAYMNRVDHYLLKYVSVSSMEMEDYDYYREFANGTSALQCARLAIEYNCEGMLIDAESLTCNMIEDARFTLDIRTPWQLAQ